MHVVFSTKERRKMIPPDMKERLWSYTAGICKHQKVFVHAIGGMEDHIHLLLQFPATIVISEAIKTIKANSSGWLADEMGKFNWQV
ncbi:MAG: IS200/IS605 family transposase, partial [Candidatus Angelobacter sp.]